MTLARPWTASTIGDIQAGAFASPAPRRNRSRSLKQAATPVVVHRLRGPVLPATRPARPIATQPSTTISNFCWTERPPLLDPEVRAARLLRDLAFPRLSAVPLSSASAVRLPPTGVQQCLAVLNCLHLAGIHTARIERKEGSSDRRFWWRRRGATAVWRRSRNPVRLLGSTLSRGAVAGAREDARAD